MHYYIPQMLPEYVEVEPHVFQPYCDATVAGWRNEQRLATRQGKHQRPGVTQMVLLADKLQIAESVPLHLIQLNSDMATGRCSVRAYRGRIDASRPETGA
jgi:hypothetical protein